MKLGNINCAKYARLSLFIIQSAKKICTVVEGHVMKEQIVSENICQEGLKSVHSSTLSHPHWGEKKDKIKYEVL